MFFQSTYGVTRKELHRNMKRGLRGEVIHIRLSAVWLCLTEFLSCLEIVDVYLILRACLWAGTLD